MLEVKEYTAVMYPVSDAKQYKLSMTGHFAGHTTALMMSGTLDVSDAGLPFTRLAIGDAVNGFVGGTLYRNKDKTDAADVNTPDYLGGIFVGHDNKRLRAAGWRTKDMEKKTHCIVLKFSPISLIDKYDDVAPAIESIKA